MEMTPEELEARKVKIDAFLNEYKELVLRHLLDFRAKIAYEPWGIVPKMEVFDVIPDEGKE